MTEKGLPIRNITTDPLGGEMRQRAEEWLKDIDPEARFIGDDAMTKLKDTEWPKGTEVIAYCHQQDREAVSRDIEAKGYKIAALVDAEYSHLPIAIKPGQYIMTIKVEKPWREQWDTRRPYNAFRPYIYDPHSTMSLVDRWMWDRLNGNLFGL